MSPSCIPSEQTKLATISEKHMKISRHANNRVDLSSRVTSLLRICQRCQTWNPNSAHHKSLHAQCKPPFTLSNQWLDCMNNNGRYTNCCYKMFIRIYFLISTKNFCRQLAKDAKHASAALTFLGVLIMGTVLYSRIWRSNSQFPEQKKTDFNSTSEYTTASGIFLTTFTMLVVILNRLSIQPLVLLIVELNVQTNCLPQTDYLR